MKLLLLFFLIHIYFANDYYISYDNGDDVEVVIHLITNGVQIKYFQTTINMLNSRPRNITIIENSINNISNHVIIINVYQSFILIILELNLY
jgi:hypothetical protein